MPVRVSGGLRHDAVQSRHPIAKRLFVMGVEVDQLRKRARAVEGPVTRQLCWPLLPQFLQLGDFTAAVSDRALAR